MLVGGPLWVLLDKAVEDAEKRSPFTPVETGPLR